MTVSVLQVTGTRGEVTPWMHARVDTEFLQSAYAVARNVVVSRYGPLTRLPGSLVKGRAKTSVGGLALVPFEFNAAQVYMLEFTAGFVRFWSPEGLIEVSGSPYEVATPYDNTDLDTLHAVQSGDKLYLFCATNDAYELTRKGETNWSLEKYVARDGPYAKPNTTATTLTPADYGSLTPKMTSNTAPWGEVTSPTPVSQGALWNIFDKNNVTYCLWGSQSGEVTFTLPGVEKAVVNAYSITAFNAVGHLISYSVASWALEGSDDGVSWVTLDVQPEQYSWPPGERRFFRFENRIPFRMYRFKWTNTDGSNTPYSAFAELSLNRDAGSQTPFDLTASSTDGINDGVGFTADDVGRSIRILGSDGRWRWLEIKSRTSPTQVKVVLHGFALPDLNPIAYWALGVFRNGQGPRTGVIYEDRMVLAGHDSDPVGVWFSVNGAYDLFRQSQPLVDDDGFSVRLTGGRFDAIQWLKEGNSLLAGTASTLRSIGTRGGEGAISHANVRQRAETHVGASASQPETLENVVLTLDVMNRRLYEVAYSYEADGFVAREVSTLSEHLFDAGVKKAVYVDAPHKMLLVLRDDGEIIFFAYDREQKVVGGTLGDFGGSVTDLGVLRGEGHPQVWLSVSRVREGLLSRTIEIMAPFFNPATPENPPVYADCAYVFKSSDPITGLSGLTELRGEVVGCYVDGRDIGDAEVSLGGSVVFPHGASGFVAVVGKRKTWRLESLRLNSFGQQDGAGLGRKVRIVGARVDLMNAADLSFGSRRMMEKVRREADVEVDPDAPTPLVTGFVPVPVDDGFNSEGVFAIGGSSMLPATIRAVALDVEGEP